MVSTSEENTRTILAIYIQTIFSLANLKPASHDTIINISE